MSILFFPGNLIFLKEVYENTYADEKKAPVRGISPKLVLYMRDQGLEPWIPCLRGGTEL